MQDLEHILKKDIEITHLDGLCVLYTAPCEPVMLEPMSFAPVEPMAPPSFGPVSSEVSAYLGNMSSQYGVPSPTTAPKVTDYNPVPVSKELVSYVSTISEQMGVSSPPITPIKPANDIMTSYANNVMEHMGVPSPTVIPSVIDYQPTPISKGVTNYIESISEQIGVFSPAITPTTFSPSYPGLNPTGISDMMKPSYELPKPDIFEPITPKTSFMEKPLFDNLSHFKEPTFMPKFEIPKFDPVNIQSIPVYEPIQQSIFEQHKEKLNLLDQNPGFLQADQLDNIRNDFVKDIGKLDNTFDALHPNDNNSGYSIMRPKSLNGIGDVFEVYNDGLVNVHITGQHSGKFSHKSNLHIDLGKSHIVKLGVEKEFEDDKHMKDLYPLFLSEKIRGK